MNSNWKKWNQKNSTQNLNQPGIYYLAYSENDISDTPFDMIKEIIYIGMTISKNGVKGRLGQFVSAMKGKKGIHGGGDRVKFKHNDEKSFFDKLYVSVCSFQLSNSGETSNDWRIKAECVKHEYVSFADYIDKQGQLPEFNDQKRSKKK